MSAFTRLTFLGTGAGMPSPLRGVSALALSWVDGSAWLFDCGEGTQQQLMRACGPAGQAVSAQLATEPPAGLTISRISRIFISHMHGDHVLGLPGLLLTLASMRVVRSEAAGAEGGGAAAAAAAGGGGGGGDEAATAAGAGAEAAGSELRPELRPVEAFSKHSEYLEIVGPVGLGRFLRTALACTETGSLGFLYRVTELVAAGEAAAAAAAASQLAAPLQPEQLQASEAPPVLLAPDAQGLYTIQAAHHPQGRGVAVLGCALQHRAPCYGYVVTEGERPGVLDAAAALALGARGAQLGELKAGRAVALPSGGSVHPEQCLGPPLPGRTAILLGDSLDNSSSAAVPSPLLRLPAAQGAAVLVHECTFCEAQAAHAAPKGHATARQAGAFAAEMGAQRLVLTHLSQRYGTRSQGQAGAAAIEAIEEEARQQLASMGHGQCTVRAVEDFEVVPLRRA